MTVKGSQIFVGGAQHDEVKLLLHKFLHHRGLTDNKVHSQSGVIEVIHRDRKDNHKSKKDRDRTRPMARETMPHFFSGR